MKYLLRFLIALILIFPYTSFATVKTFVREYSYSAGEADSKLSSRAIALEQLKRLLLEELGTYLESQTDVKNFEITKDMITTLSAGVVQTVILDEKWDGRIYWMKARLDADPDKVKASLNELRNDRKRTNEFEAMKKTADDALAEIARLKAELARKKDAASKQALIDDVRKEANKLAAKEWLDKGQYLANSKDYEGAVVNYNRAIELDPKSAWAHIYRASSKMMLADFYGALSDYDKAIELDPKNATAYATRAWAKGGLNDFGNALKDGETAVTLDPKLALAYYFRGWARWGLKDYNGAIKDFDKAIEFDSKLVWAYIWRASSKMMLADFYGALSDYNKAIELDPKNATAYANRAWARGGLNDFSNALKDGDTAVALDPKLALAFYFRGWSKGGLKDYNGAIRDLDKAIELNPKMGYAFYFRANFKADLGNTAGADSDYTTASRLGCIEAQQLSTKKGLSW